MRRNQETIDSAGCAPGSWPATFPLRSRWITGMPLTAKRAARLGFSSVLIWIIAALPASISAAFRTAGANERQCGHQGAQNSASIGPS